MQTRKEEMGRRSVLRKQSGKYPPLGKVEPKQLFKKVVQNLQLWESGKV